MYNNFIRFLRVLLAIFFLMTGTGAPTYAQSSMTPDDQMSLFMPSIITEGSDMQTRSAGGPVNFGRVDVEVRGGVQRIAQAQCVNKAYTPVADADGNLRMIGMSIVGNNLDSLPETGDDFIAGEVNDIAVTQLKGCNYLVSAVRTESNGLKLISWLSSADGFDRLHDTNEGGATTEVEIVSFGHPSNSHPGAALLVTASRTSSGYLVMQTWGHNPDTGFSIGDTEISEQASEIAMVAIETATDDESYTIGRVVTAFRTPAGNLKLVSWQIDMLGGIVRDTDSGNQAGEAQEIAIVRYDSRRVVTAVKNGDGNLQLIPWKLEIEHHIVRLHGEEDPTFNDPYAGAVQEIAMTPFYFNYVGFDYVATAVRTEDGNLRLIAWGIDSWGNIKRHGDSGDQAGAASHIQVGWSQESNRIVTSMRDADDNLRVIAWTAQ